MIRRTPIRIARKPSNPITVNSGREKDNPEKVAKIPTGGLVKITQITVASPHKTQIPPNINFITNIILSLGNGNGIILI
ncbi:MAG: hypothetical protein KAS54_01420 [Dehalococcoidia bacterium]|nr:hypothetical protein [Dehalococcoidia bacterium]